MKGLLNGLLNGSNNRIKGKIQLRKPWNSLSLMEYKENLGLERERTMRV